jgi:hypothetical protein
MIRLLAPLCLTAALMLGAASDQPQPQRAFLVTWQQAIAKPDKAAEQLQLYADANWEHDLGRLATLLQGVALLRTDTAETQLDEALQCFEFKRHDRQRPAKPGRTLVRRIGTNKTKKDTIPASPLRKRIDTAGKVWAARIAMLRLGRKLRLYYRSHVQYPMTLSELVREGHATGKDLLDPFGQPYVYAATPRKLMPKVARQAYTLACKTTGATHRQLKQALRQAFEPTRQVAVSTISSDLQRVFVRTTRKDGSISPAQNWSVGETLNNMTLWAIRDGFIIIGTGDRPTIVAVQDQETTAGQLSPP